MLKEKDANAENQTGLPDGAGGAEGVRKGFEHEERNREIFEDDGQLDSSGAQNTSDLMEVAGILAGGDFDNLSDEDLAKIRNPALRAQLQGKALEAKQAAEIRAQDIAMRQQAWDRGDVICHVAGTKLNSRQVDNILKMMADPQQKAKLVEKFSKEQGIPKKEAEDKLDQAARTLAVVKKKELDPNAVLTPQEQEDYDRRNDPKLAPAVTFLKNEEQKTINKYAVGVSDEEYKQIKSETKETSSPGPEKVMFLGHIPAVAADLGEDGYGIKTDVAMRKDFHGAANANAKPPEPEAEPPKPAPQLAVTSAVVSRDQCLL